LRLLGSIAAATVGIVVASGCLTVNATPPESGAADSIAIERSDEPAGAKARSGNALPSNPSESSFGTPQEDGTFCGVTCWENH
jgi:hypothetical protein